MNEKCVTNKIYYYYNEDIVMQGGGEKTFDKLNV